MATTPFQPQYTWRKLGYLAYTDSLSYREVLEQNPQWDVVTLPPLGAQISINTQNTRSSSLLQSAFVFGGSSADVSDEIFPFNSQVDYFESLNKYTVQGVTNRDRINGYSFDSYSARTGLQG